MARAECLQATNKTDLTEFALHHCRISHVTFVFIGFGQIPCQLLLCQQATGYLQYQDCEPLFATCHLDLESRLAISLHTQAVSTQHEACGNVWKQGRAVHQGTWSASEHVMMIILTYCFHLAFRELAAALQGGWGTLGHSHRPFSFWPGAAARWPCSIPTR